ncbi:ankyrin repeat domain-containing protein [archaeon]|nr:MAG: ankyrin repeat domain-containing protein [archaeon]
MLLLNHPYLLSFFHGTLLCRFIAVEKGFLSFVQLAYEKHPACISETCTADGGLTPLDVSILFKKAQITKLLLSLGVSSNSMCIQENLPIAFLAVREGNVHAFQLLIEFGADLHYRVNDRNVVYYIVQKGLVDAFFVYKSCVSFDVNASVGLAEENIRPLHVAAMFDHPHFVSLFISMGADMFATNALQQTALDIAKEVQAKRAELALLSYLR